MGWKEQRASTTAHNNARGYEEDVGGEDNGHNRENNECGPDL